MATLLTGLGVDRHGCYTGIRPAPFEYHYVPEDVHGDPFWVDVASADRRVLVIDPPAFPARRGIGADQLIEWGCHDRYYGPHSEPPELLAEVVARVGRIPQR